MFNRVLVGVDGRQGGRDAIALATRLTAPAGKLTLAHVYPYHRDPPVRGYDEYEAAQITRARELLATASTEGGIEAHHRWTAGTSPGRGLHQLAEAVSADLLVVGSPQRGPLGRVLVGDDTRAALDGAPCAVAIAPTGYASQSAVIRKVGVGYDGSAESERALIVARALAAEVDAKLAALQVVVFPWYMFSGPLAGDATMVGRLVDQARTRVAALGDIEAHATAGPAAEQLASWSASVDLLLVGSRGFGPIGRLAHGSTSRKLTCRARCPLLVLTRTRRTAAHPAHAVEDLELAAARRR
ncbi:MAG TPA: universal stress protein [Solirubrobacteraceae bacterium]|nr:universal stress protein [Solirubrobacteraceae bacterium]